MQRMKSMSVRDVVKEVAHAHKGKRTNFNINVSTYEDHHRININSLMDFEIDILQSSLKDEGYESYRFDRNGNQFLKVPLSE